MENRWKEKLDFPPIPEDNTKIWRYIDFTQLVSILEREALWFNRADSFEDPLEGSYSKPTVRTRRERIQKNLDLPSGGAEKARQGLALSAKLFKRSSYVNCWHIKGHESKAMWELYSMKGKGVAIQSSIARIKKALEANGAYFRREDRAPPNELPNSKFFTIGKVTYLNYEEDLMPEAHYHSPLFHKRKSYQHENEFRIVTTYFSGWPGESGETFSIDESELSELDLPIGKYIGLDYELLINKIRISPASPKWFINLVKKILNRYKLNSNLVERSELDKEPIFTEEDM